MATSSTLLADSLAAAQSAGSSLRDGVSLDGTSAAAAAYRSVSAQQWVPFDQQIPVGEAERVFRVWHGDGSGSEGSEGGRTRGA